MSGTVFGEEPLFHSVHANAPGSPARSHPGFRPESAVPKVVAGDLEQVDEVHSGRGYQSHHGTRLHFGLGKRDRVDRIEVRWIGAAVDVLEDLAADQLLTIVEGSEKVAAANRSAPHAESARLGVLATGEKQR